MRTRRPRVFCVAASEARADAVRQELDGHGVAAVVSPRLSPLREFHAAAPVDLVLVDAALERPTPEQIRTRLGPALPEPTRIVLLGGLGDAGAFHARFAWPTGPGVLSHALRSFWAREAEQSGVSARERRELAAEVELRSVRLGRQNLFERLDLQPGAGTDMITAAHDRLSMRLHPDRIAELLPEDLRPVALDVYLAIGEAYRLLRDPAHRRTYASGLKAER